MLTLRRFKALTRSYGADLRRWPEATRADAKALLASSPLARALHDEARTLDDAFETANLGARAAFPRDAQEAALARVRAGVAARIARPRPEAGPRRAWSRIRRGAGDPAWAGMMAGGIAIVAGLMVGTLFTTEPEAENLMSILQPAPIYTLAE